MLQAVALYIKQLWK